MSGTLRLTLVKSYIGRPETQRATLRALGLRRLHQSVEFPASATLQGQIDKVRHLLEVTELPGT
jgi:large subunit ribosomal protein L30